MIIIIEGIDRVGKTTLANKISDKFNIPIYKQERIGGNDIDLSNTRDVVVNNNVFMNYVRAMSLVDFWNWRGFEQDIIMDRFHWTEAVYSLVDRHTTESMHNMKKIEKMMLEQKDKYLVIQVMPVDIKRCNKMHGSDLSQHQKEFDKLYEESKLNKYRCTYFSDDLCINMVEKMLSERKK